MQSTNVQISDVGHHSVRPWLYLSIISLSLSVSQTVHLSARRTAGKENLPTGRMQKLLHLVVAAALVDGLLEHVDEVNEELGAAYTAGTMKKLTGTLKKRRAWRRVTG